MALKRHKGKRKGVGLEVQTFTGESGTTYTVFRTTGGSFHVLTEVEAKAAARDCGAKRGTTRQRWDELWK